MKKIGMKMFLVFALSVALAWGGVFTSYAGEWIYDGPEDWQWRYKNDDGGYTKNGWQEIDSKWYHFDENGYLDVNQWIMEEEQIGGEEGVYIIEKWYWLGETGEMATSGSWEGGHINSDGVLQIDNIYWDGYELDYFDGATNYYSGTLEWKKQLAKAWESAIGGRDDAGVYTLDFQLPSNWAEQCPNPLISALIKEISWYSWTGEMLDGSYSWIVDESYVIHITAEIY